MAVWSGAGIGRGQISVAGVERQDRVQFAVRGNQECTGETAAANRILYLLVALLALAGMGVLGISLERHYATSATKFCDVGEKFNCDIVNRSEYSSGMGIPVAGIGVAGYGVLLELATLYRSRRETPLRLLLAAVAGLGFALYLTYVEGYV